MGDYKSKLEKLNPKQIALLNHKLGELLSSNSTKVDLKKRLVSFVTSDDKDIDVEFLKTILKNQLPNYMVPDSIIKLDKFKHLPNGKIDLKNLPIQKVIQIQKANDKPQYSEIEEALIDVWESVLNIKPIHVNDNFFELGGDSILSIQIISKLRSKGLILKANSLFNNQTIKELAPFVSFEKSETTNIQDLLVGIWEVVLNIKPIHIDDNFFELGGDSILSIQIISGLRKKGYTLKANDIFNNQSIKELSLFVKKEKSEIASEESSKALIITPIQHWFFDLHKNAPHFWNQICEVEIPQTFSYAKVESILSKLIETHDGLKLGFHKLNGSWESEILSDKDRKLITYKDFSDLEEADLESKTEDFIYKHQDDYSLLNTILFRGLIINHSNDKPKKLLLIAHHLVVDYISWQTIKNDFLELYNQTINNKPLYIESRSSSFAGYNNKFNQLKESNALLDTLDYWKSQTDINQQFPVDNTSTLPIIESDVRIKTIQLNEVLTTKIINNTKEKSHLTVEEIVIAALAKTICEWSTQTDLVILKENHGRQTEADHSDFSETIGWLTSILPVKLSYHPNQDLKSFILSVKETVRNIPNNGLDYGILRYLAKDESVKSSLKHSAPIVFNYLGVKKENTNTDDLLFNHKLSNTRSHLSERNYYFEINTLIVEDKLEINWSYSEKFHNSHTITKLLSKTQSHLEALVDYYTEFDSNSYSASDFPDSDLDNDDLNELLSQL
jgi:non-ribosomal peptide synthase protein (TIGR01720 family)